MQRRAVEPGQFALVVAITRSHNRIGFRVTIDAIDDSRVLARYGALGALLICRAIAYIHFARFSQA